MGRSYSKNISNPLLRFLESTFQHAFSIGTHLISVMQQNDRYELRVDNNLFSHMGNHYYKPGTHSESNYQGPKTVDKLDWDEFSTKTKSPDESSLPKKDVYKTYAPTTSYKEPKVETRKSIPSKKEIPSNISFNVKLKPPTQPRQTTSNPPKEETPFDWGKEEVFDFGEEKKETQKSTDAPKNQNILDDDSNIPISKNEKKKENEITLDFLAQDTTPPKSSNAPVQTQGLLSDLDFSETEKPQTQNKPIDNDLLFADDVKPQAQFSTVQPSKAKPNTIDLYSLYSTLLI